MKKRVLSLFLALGLCLGMLPTAALAAEVTVTEVAPCKYDEVKDFSEGLAAVKLNDKWGFIDATGKEVVLCKYSEVKDFSEGLAAVKLNDKWGFIDKTGKEVMPCTLTYGSVGPFSEGLAMVTVDSEVKLENVVVGMIIKYGFIDKTGKEVVPPGKYRKIKDFSDGLAAVEGDSGEKDKWGAPIYKWGFIDKTGKEVMPCALDYEDIGPFSDGLAAVKLNDNWDHKWGFIDKTGKEVVPCKYYNLNPNNVIVAPFFSDGLAAGKGDSGEKYKAGNPIYKWGFIDATGKEVVPCTLDYEEVESFSEGLAAVQVEGEENSQIVYKWGFIDKTGKEVAPCKYDHVNSFSEGLAAVYNVDYFRGYEWGFIDKTGKEVVPLGKYSSVNNFSKGLAAVYARGKGWGFIDATGKEVVPCTLTYSNIKPFSEGFAAVAVKAENGKYKWGFISVNGSATPTPAPTATTAYASTQTVMVDNKPVEFNAYALKDANGNMTNYVKLRDVASVLNGSAAQFQVGWDGSISITTKQAYTANGSEMVQNFSGDQQYTVNTSPVKVNGQTADMEAITLTDSTGGYTYFKLRDLGKTLGFNVSWTDGKIVIDPNSPYSDAN